MNLKANWDATTQPFHFLTTCGDDSYYYYTSCRSKRRGGVRMAFGRAFVFQSRGIGIVVYPDDTLGDQVGEADWIVEGIEASIQGCAEKLAAADYAICFAWRDGTDFMVDMWTFSGTDTWGSGPLADVAIFREGKPDGASGVGSGNSLLVLGLEETLRRQSIGIEAYLRSTRPSLPPDLVLDA